MGDLARTLRTRAWLLMLGPLVVGVVAVGITFLISPTFTATTAFLPPQQSQGSMGSALASLGSLAGLGSGGSGVRGSGDQYVALLQSVSVSDRVIDQFKLVDQYAVKFHSDARRELARNVRMAYGKKDGILTVEVDDKSPQRAADMANSYVQELRRLSSTIAVTEAQQRRAFFEQQLESSRDRLAQAQLALQSSGFNPGALKAEPKAAADSYVRLKAEATSAEIRLQTLRSSLTDNAPEVRQQASTLAAIRDQLARFERTNEAAPGPDYISRYRDFKYQETLFDLYARQFELARVDESREGALVQVVDIATPPETKSKPRRGLVGAGAAASAFLVLLAWTFASRNGQSRPNS